MRDVFAGTSISSVILTLKRSEAEGPMAFLLFATTLFFALANLFPFRLGRPDKERFREMRAETEAKLKSPQ